MSDEDPEAANPMSELEIVTLMRVPGEEVEVHSDGLHPEDVMVMLLKALVTTVLEEIGYFDDEEEEGVAGEDDG